MKVLISSVGNTDPILKNHDGPLLHIARWYRPEKIILIVSESMVKKVPFVKQVLLAIDGYQPEIVVSDLVISDKEIFLFDKMFEQLNHTIQQYINDKDEFLLNLSSATPQVISALYTINQINEYNVKAVQVASPNAAPPYNFDLTEEKVMELIAGDIDYSEQSTNRVIEDKAEKVSASLVKRNLREMIRNHDYQAAYNVMTHKKSKEYFSNRIRNQINSILDELVHSLKYQTVSSFVKEASEKVGLGEKGQLALNYFLIMNRMRERELMTDFLIKCKSLAEFLLEDYLHLNYPELVVSMDGFPKVNPNHKQAEYVFQMIEAEIEAENKRLNTNRKYNREAYLNLLSFQNMIDCLDPENEITNLIKSTKAINGARNKVAHGLSAIDINNVKSRTLVTIENDLKKLIMKIYQVDESIFSLYDDVDSQLLTLLK
ncbi:type III-A CRISPR-associated protein Csm6 [Tuanshanicoccus lijuaniae]|uniref:type III-A CRISPR-associated CARF protein Csm6 n=1 Tax=Aerococcaceae bacterium zg-1292 TaxID=2774330 RepID=UPI00193520C6|nr:type III-A CRISPR-associated protein Csm6 [Aerococcaceae bacterium zg-1292]QQA36557.1 type III-A CRISPR-associated protein Csm6 [Aerococcaceae bacterium zg-1292]